ncbi:Protein PRD1 [Morella rubra]|uniref:Protein PRD1 n=1 Tax=Morella rubra TaxID=262757 RepID=A0A6A1VLL7_9ROSI|nr:Protein PRD1 [Morella rubra]
MFFNDSQELDLDLAEEAETLSYCDPPPAPPQTCPQGHRSTLILKTQQGGSICLLCFSNLLSNPLSPTLYISYALSQLSQALSQPQFLHSILSFHSHFLVSPLVKALSSYDDDPIARQVTDIIVDLCGSDDGSLCGEFVARVSDMLASGTLAWSRRQVFMLGKSLFKSLNFQPCISHFSTMKRNTMARVAGQKFPFIKVFQIIESYDELRSEEIRGEILFVLYKISILQYTSEDGDGTDVLLAFCPKILYLVVDSLMKTQIDDVRLNCLGLSSTASVTSFLIPCKFNDALLTVLSQRGFFANVDSKDASSMNSYDSDNFIQAAEDGKDGLPLNIIFAEAIKGPLLSSDSQVRQSSLDLLFHYMSCQGASGKPIQFLVEENIADYVFEILRLSEFRDPVVNSCIKVLDLLSTAGQAFKQRLVVGFATLIPVVRYVAEVPFHPVQNQTLKLIRNYISDCPGILTTSQIEELVLVFTRMLEKHTDGEMGMLPDAFITVCSVFVDLMKYSSSHGNLNLARSVQEASKHAILSCLDVSEKHARQLLHALYLLKEAYLYGHEENFTSSSKVELRNYVLDICTKYLLPWFVTAINELEEETTLGLLETFHSLLLLDSDIQALKLAKALVSSSWISFSFGCLGLYPTEKMKCRVYLMLSSLVDVILGNDAGKPIRDAALYLPADPIDLLFFLGQKSSHNLELSSCQSAALLILYTSSLYDESIFFSRLADEKLVLASLEQYLLVNSSDFKRGAPDSLSVTRLVNLYGLFRGLAKMSYQIPYSSKAETILFQLMTENEWDLPSAILHSVSLKWLFQQEKIGKQLSHQILKFCRSNCSNGIDILVHGRNRVLNVTAIAEIVAAGDSYGATIIVCLLTELAKDDGQEHDIISVVNLVETIISIFPAGANQLCLCGIGKALYTLYYDTSYSFSLQILKVTSAMTFRILSLVQPEILSDDENWLAVTMKLMEHFEPPVAADSWNHESLLVIGILSLVLHHSTNGVLVEASKSILFKTSLISAINSTISAATLKGPALVDHDEGTSLGQSLIFVLLLNYFSFRSLPAVLPGFVDWQSFFDPPTRMQPLSFIGIHCRDLCRLMHFGSSPVKLVASYSLLELLTRLSDQRYEKHFELRCTIKFLMSIIAVLQGLIFYSHLGVAMNCGLCLSIILGWEMLDMQETTMIEKNSWSRLIVEELAMSLAAPCLAPKSFINYHKPAIPVAVTLLKLQKIPGWMRSVFDDTCISCIIESLSASKLSTEMVFLLRELMNSDFLKAEQIANLNRVLQACRKEMYADITQDKRAEEHEKKMAATPDDLGEVCEYLICLISTESTLTDSRGLDFRNKRVLEEIELFFRTLTMEDDG